MEKWLARYDHSWVFLYWIVYLAWFGWLEENVTSGYYVIQSALDQWIPFHELFVVPYLLWFPYVAAVIGWFFLHDKKEFYRLTAYLYLGMTIFLIVCTIFPNGVSLRPAVLPRDNILTELVRAIWTVDTPTNVLPSLHVYNSVVCCVAVFRDEQLGRSGWLKGIVLMLTISIVLSTMFLKQHSVIDVVTALTMAGALYEVFYQPSGYRRAKKLGHMA